MIDGVIVCVNQNALPTDLKGSDQRKWGIVPSLLELAG
jgi:hypothetical protein